MSAANEKPPADAHWRPLSEAYHVHHANCAACKSAGRGDEYGQRCVTGAPMWTAYQAAR